MKDNQIKIDYTLNTITYLVSTRMLGFDWKIRFTVHSKEEAISLIQRYKDLGIEAKYDEV